MPIELVGIIGVIIMFMLMFLGIPIAISMAVPAILGIYYLKGGGVLLSLLDTTVWKNSSSYSLSTVPMFILMGEFLLISGISGEIFELFRRWFNRMRGGLAIATVGASGLFAAASGSSLATTSTMGLMAIKEMNKSGYDKSLSAGTVAAGGTLGILIPPSTAFIIYGTLTDSSIGKLFMAGVLPGLLLMVLFMLTVYGSVWFQMKKHPDSGNYFSAQRYSWAERFAAFKVTIWILLLFALVIGGMYGGLFGPTEAGGVGALGAFIIALIRKKMTWANFKESLSRTVLTSAFLFAIIVAAFFLNYFLAITKLPTILAEFMTTAFDNPILILSLIIVMYIILGAIMDSMAMLVVTIPIVLPTIQQLGYDLVWFGVLIVILIEMALITPPMGMNCFVLKGVVPEIKLETIFKGALRFVLPLLILIVLLIAFPDIALFLPNSMQ